jgi:hypothetical protein
MVLSEALNKKAKAALSEVPVEQGWQELLVRGQQAKVTLLSSSDFKTMAQASELLGIGEAAVRNHIQESKLFAMKIPADGEHRIPAWALDPAIAGKVTTTLLSDSGGAEEWLLYHALAVPNGSLNGLSPVECLMSCENLPADRRDLRDELSVHLRLAPNGPLLEAVRLTLRAALEDAASIRTG